MMLTSLLFSIALLAGQPNHQAAPTMRQDTVHTVVDTATLRSLLNYPQPAYGKRDKGFVLALYIVDSKGAGEQVGIRNHGGGDDSAQFGRAVTGAMRGVRFRPASVNGENVGEGVIVAVSFNIGLADGKPFPEYTINLHYVTTAEAMEMSDRPARPQSSPESVSAPSAADEPEPEFDVFVPAEVMPKYDESELARNVQFPEKARRNGIEGLVVVMALVGKDGHVVKTMIERSDNRIFDDPAAEAVMKTRFTPALLNRHPIAFWVHVPVQFSLGH